jgi:hypothetical protein
MQHTYNLCVLCSPTCGYRNFISTFYIRAYYITQRWKSQRIKIHRLAYRLLNPYPGVWIFVWKSQRFGFWFKDFFIEIFKIHRLVWIFLWIFACFKYVSSMFCAKLLPILNFTLFYQRRPLKAYLYYKMVSCVPKKSIG